MNTFGNLQNEIDGLAKLSSSDYERIFRVHTDEADGKNFYFYNILRKLEFPQDLNSEYVDFYQVTSAMPLTILAYNVYGNIKMWWLIYLLNKAALKNNLFVVPAGVKLQYIKAAALPLIYSQITKQVVYNGRHY